MILWCKELKTHTHQQKSLGKFACQRTFKEVVYDQESDNDINHVNV